MANFRVLILLALALLSGFIFSPAQANFDQYDLGRAEVTANGLTYLFSVTYLSGVSKYLLELRVRNSTERIVQVAYASGEQFDFSVGSGNEILWRYNMNRFYVQTTQSMVLKPNAEAVYRAEWNGQDRNGQVVDLHRITVTAIHTSSSHGLSIALPNVQTYRSITEQSAQGNIGKWGIVPCDHWAYSALDYLVEQQVLSGYPMDYFAGEHELYQCDFIIAIAKALECNQAHLDAGDQIGIMLETLRAAFAEQI